MLRIFAGRETLQKPGGSLPGVLRKPNFQLLLPSLRRAADWAASGQPVPLRGWNVRHNYTGPVHVFAGGRVPGGPALPLRGLAAGADALSDGRASADGVPDGCRPDALPFGIADADYAGADAGVAAYFRRDLSERASR